MRAKVMPNYFDSQLFPEIVIKTTHFFENVKLSSQNVQAKPT
jgi:hypothetical protein